MRPDDDGGRAAESRARRKRSRFGGKIEPGGSAGGDGSKAMVAGSVDHELAGAAVPKPHVQARNAILSGNVVECLSRGEPAVIDDVLPVRT
eukprot:SAG31_NODE_16825_length_694_cov_1.025210_2_plen_91_part_00